MSQDYSIRQVGGVLATNDANYRKEHFKNALKHGFLMGIAGSAIGVGALLVKDSVKGSARAVSIFDKGVKITEKVLNKLVKKGAGSNVLTKLKNLAPKYKIFGLAIGLGCIVGSLISQSDAYNQGKIDGKYQERAAKA